MIPHLKMVHITSIREEKSLENPLKERKTALKLP